MVRWVFMQARPLLLARSGRGERRRVIEEYNDVDAWLDQWARWPFTGFVSVRRDAYGDIGENPSVVSLFETFRVQITVLASAA